MIPVPPNTINLQAESRKTALIYRSAAMAQLPHMVLGMALAYVNISLGAPLWPAVFWCACVVLTSGSRLWLSLAFKKANPSDANMPKWRTRYVNATIISGLCWGLGSAYFMWKAPESAQLFTALILAGLVAGGVGLLSPVPLAIRAFSLAVLAPCLFVLTLQADSTRNWVFCIGVALHLVLIWLSSSNLHETIDNSIRLELAQQELANELQSAQKAALAASRTKSEFLANMSHEIRTPLNGVLGMADLMGTTNLTAEQRGYLDILQASGKGLLVIINDILDLSKAQEGKITLERVEFDMRELLFSSSAPLVSEAHAKGLSIRTEIDPALPDRLIGDPMRLRQVLTNFIANAVKFTPQGEVIIIVNAGPSDATRLTVYFTVRDTGIGIAPEYHQTIFDSFSQADGSITRRFGGTGLGLAICKHLVELMRGRIWMNSEPGIGSEFHFAVSLDLVLPQSQA